MSAAPYASQQGMISREADQVAVQPIVKSKPVYMPLSADSKTRNHLLVAELGGLEVVLRVLDELSDPDRSDSVDVYWLGSVPEAFANHASVYTFDSQPALLRALEQRLSISSMGMCLYIAGRESFLWQVSHTAYAAGLREDEIRREACGSEARCVFCIHCRSFIENVVTNSIVCPSCGELLEVRDHFSRALAAYMGVGANAENPFDVPETLERSS